MKKLLIVLLSLVLMPLAFADETANIKINVSGLRDNNYFMCLPNVGCLSMLAAKAGKIYPLYRSIKLHDIYVLDIRNNLRITSEGLPASCNQRVQTGQTITISGKLTPEANGSVRLNQLHCSVA